MGIQYHGVVYAICIDETYSIQHGGRVFDCCQSRVMGMMSFLPAVDSRGMCWECREGQRLSLRFLCRRTAVHTLSYSCWLVHLDPFVTLPDTSKPPLPSTPCASMYGFPLSVSLSQTFLSPHPLTLPHLAPAHPSTTNVDFPPQLRYNACITALARCGRWRQALAVLDYMRHTANAVESRQKAGSDVAEGVPVKSPALPIAVRPDVFSYSAAITACGNCGEWRRALALLRVMREQGVPPNVSFCVAKREAVAFIVCLWVWRVTAQAS